MMSSDYKDQKEMLDDEAQTALDEALAAGAATYEISKGRRALILTVISGDRIIPLLDQIFGFSDLDLASNGHRNPGSAVPAVTIGEYVVTPKLERKEIAGNHVYEFSYTKRGLSP